MGFLGSVYWNSFTALSLRNAIALILRKQHVWFDRAKQIWQRSQKTDLQPETEDECANKCGAVYFTVPLHRYCALNSWLFLLFCTWDFIICYNMQDKDYLWRCKEHNKAVEPMEMLPETDSL